MVVDSSALLAILFYDPGTEWAVAQLEEHAGELRMSSVSLTETKSVAVSICLRRKATVRSQAAASA